MEPRMGHRTLRRASQRQGGTQGNGDRPCVESPWGDASLLLAEDMQLYCCWEMSVLEHIAEDNVHLVTA